MQDLMSGMITSSPWSRPTFAPGPAASSSSRRTSTWSWQSSGPPLAWHSRWRLSNLRFVWFAIILPGERSAPSSGIGFVTALRFLKIKRNRKWISWHLLRQFPVLTCTLVVGVITVVPVVRIRWEPYRASGSTAAPEKSRINCSRLMLLMIMIKILPAVGRWTLYRSAPDQEIVKRLGLLELVQGGHVLRRVLRGGLDLGAVLGVLEDAFDLKCLRIRSRSTRSGLILITSSSLMSVFGENFSSSAEISSAKMTCSFLILFTRCVLYLENNKFWMILGISNTKWRFYLAIIWLCLLEAEPPFGLRSSSTEFDLSKPEPEAVLLFWLFFLDFLTSLFSLMSLRWIRT